MKRLGITFCGCIFALSVAGNSFAQDVKVGTLFDHSGALQDWGERHQNAAELAAEQLNRAGWTISLVHGDSQSSAEAAKKAALRLVEEDKVLAILGSSSSGVVVPVAESVTIPHGILMISPGATAPYISTLQDDQGKDLLFRTCPSDKLQGVVLGKLAAGLYSTASILYVDNPYGQGLARQFQHSFEKRGGLATMVPHGEEVASSYVSELRSAFSRKYGSKPMLAGKFDVLCAFSYPEHAKIYIKEGIEVFHGKNFLFSDGTKSEKLIQEVGADKLEGMMGTAPGGGSGSGFEKFKAFYTVKYADFPASPFIANAYDAAALVGLASYAVQAKGQELSSQSIRDQLREVANPPGIFVGPGEFETAFRLLDMGKAINYEGASGNVDFDSNGDVVTPIEVWKIENGKIVTFRIESQIPEE
ncbi:ABC transporter substrate-binding protein [Desulfogranum mediterraneum]|uniref:ABC transporter substrate-binding protein n=1 Tax=Desulfogranum mediterraneum TaxID=160661 RepID=UPI0003F7EF34|nr:ABC transporter substrate-binding protein [Desulfogranum mediterraneum]